MEDQKDHPCPPMQSQHSPSTGPAVCQDGPLDIKYLSQFPTGRGRQKRKERPNPRHYINLLIFMHVNEHVNLDPSILPNITLGYHIYDSCTDPRKAVKSVLQILSGTGKTVPNYSCTDKNKLAGFIGDHYSITTIPIAQLLVLYGYAQISYGVTEIALNERHLYPHLFHTHQNNRVYFKTVSKLLKTFGWSWVGIIASDNDSGDTDIQILKKYITNHGFCVAFSFKINVNDKLINIKRKLKMVQKSSARVILLCGPFTIAVVDIFVATKLDNVFHDKTLIIPPSWASNYFLTDFNNEQLNGSLAMDFYYMPLPNMSFIDNIHPSNRPEDILLEDIWLIECNCLSRKPNKNKMYSNIYRIKPNNCTEGKNPILTDIYKADSISSGVYYSVIAMAIAFNQMHLNMNDTVRQGKHLSNYRHKHQIPKSQCSESCLPGYRKVLKPRVQTCCFDCVHCSEGEISNSTDSVNCIRCPENEWSSNKRDECIPKLVEFLPYNNEAIAVVSSCVSIIFCLLTLVILTIFIIFQNTSIVKANNKTLSFLLLVSIMLSFLCVFLFLGRPVDVTCMLRQSTFAIIFSIAISSVLGKTIMICIVFKATKPGSVWKKWVNIKVTNSVVFLCSFIQILINVSWLAISPPFQEMDIYSYKEKIIIQCNEGSFFAFSSSFGYMGFLAAVSFILAFLARTLPDSFNEAKYITFSMLIFCSVWIAMIPAYLSTKGKYVVAVEIFAILTSSAALLSCIFFPKCFIIMFRPELNVKSNLFGYRTN
ncbi:vomeronasal type-2 receptor 26-like [Pelobates fuscus]|uniref:vomeronasal type-2 receptor 26-like n=1 Tax=Pelobates fuscus TaxID=191477 RepID=UPI002FE43F00